MKWMDERASGGFPRSGGESFTGETRCVFSNFATITRHMAFRDIDITKTMNFLGRWLPTYYS